MADDELEKLREEKMEQLSGDSGQDVEAERDRQRQQIKEKARQYLSSEAVSRLGNIRAAKPELASTIEAQIARMGEMGQIDELTEDQLKDILRKLQNSGDETSIRHR